MNRAQKAIALVLLAIPAVCCLGGIFVVNGYSSSAESKIEANKVEAKKIGMPIEPQDLTAIHPVSPDQNAAPAYEAAIALSPESSPEYAQINNVIKGNTSFRFAKPTIQPILMALDEATSKPECRFSRDYTKGVNATFPELMHLRTFQKLFAAEADSQAAAGDWKGALATLRKMHRLSEHAGSDPIIISALVQVAMEAITERQVRKTANELAQHSAFISKALDMERNPTRLPDMRLAMAGELMLARYGLKTIKGPSEVMAVDNEDGSIPKASPLEQAAFHSRLVQSNLEERVFSLYLQLYKEIPTDPEDLDGIDKAFANLDARANSDRSLFAARNQIFTPVFSQAGSTIRKTVTDRRLSITYLRLIQTRQRTGSFPAKLSDFGKDRIDPYSGIEFRYRREGEGFVLYSVGQDRRDDGGVTEGQRKDMVTSFK